MINLYSFTVTRPLMTSIHSVVAEANQLACNQEDFEIACGGASWPKWTVMLTASEYMGEDVMHYFTVIAYD